ncbi:hypothetical protein N7508_004922 [Penicillium antarcticum]|uniref:uncharacterized protein n=1 Tax=Penicillium antarcticum TaxID=416450 RepID=UPI00238B3675|nr:uncharacterized protein N7508_004922 [Penicillium antarcticum]KAJ5305907.1 hypothetical protein N7508_004922 [Penicillium antarcticum]
MSSFNMVHAIGNYAVNFPAKTFSGAVIGCLALYHFYSKFSTTRKNQAVMTSEKHNLADELVLLTGGSGGIGKHIIEHLAHKKARVLVLDVKKPEFELSTGIAFYQTDITSTNDISRVASKIRSLHGDPTVLVNAAGIFHCGSLLEKSEREIRETFEVNTVSHFLLIKEFLPSMIKHNRGHIITIASIASFVTVAEMVDYCCTKASALAFHEGVKQELKYWYNAPNVKTSIIHPLWVETSMIKGFMQYQSQFAQPIMKPEVVAKAVLEQVLLKRGDQVFLPKKMWIGGVLRALPQRLQEMIRSVYSKILWRVRNARLADKEHSS